MNLIVYKGHSVTFQFWARLMSQLWRANHPECSRSQESHRRMGNASRREIFFLAEIRVEGLTKRYGRFQALKDVSFDVHDGELAVLLGPSGCGKTTLLRCIAGLEHLDGGQVYLENELVNDLPPQRRDLAMVFQGFSLFPIMSVRDNIGFPLKVRGQAIQTIADRVTEVAKVLGIEGLLDKSPKELSGGEQQRVAIGRAIARGPKAFLMDEPLTSLDAPLRTQLRSELKRIQKEIRVTTIYVTHDQGEALVLADRIGIMNSGTLLQYGGPQEVMKNPANVFIARFLGEPQSNVLSAEISGKEDRSQAYLEGDGFRYPLPNELAIKLTTQKVSGNRLQVALRPEDITLSPQQLPEESVTGEVILDEPFTLYKLITVRVGKVDLKVVVSKDTQWDAHQKVWLRMNLERAHFFSGNDGDILL